MENSDNGNIFKEKNLSSNNVFSKNEELLIDG